MIASARGRRALEACLVTLLLLAGCQRREAEPASLSPEEAASKDKADNAASAARADESYRETSKAARAAADRSIDESNRREAERVEGQENTTR
ncbi:MAG TPA: hypothetical protein VF704_11740 [Allosphingosinicella sp.]|jgi:uncharacterized lipoprotein YajG